MDVSVCPMAVVRAPVETVWALLADPQGYGAFWDMRVDRVVPPGPARAGQVVEGWPARLTIDAVDAERRQIRFTTTLPRLFGLGALNVITCTPLDAARCRVAYG
ncbi:MAG TPA: SRPBCC family protein [Thermomicrobiales bacterium]|nr:SRPBCC family protein [Thermomicrobiales bacterium]